MDEGSPKAIIDLYKKILANQSVEVNELEEPAQEEETDQNTESYAAVAGTEKSRMVSSGRSRLPLIPTCWNTATGKRRLPIFPFGMPPEMSRM